jgi:hypothetical protein
MNRLVVPVNTKSVPTFAVKTPPLARDDALESPGGIYTRLIALPEEKSR